MHMLAIAAALILTHDDGAHRYANDEVAPFLTQCRDLHKDLAAANDQRSEWPRYSTAWKSWSASDAKAATDGYTRREYIWSTEKSDEARALVQGVKSYRKLASFEKRSNGKIKSIIITDARGGAVAATTLEDDWYQGDERPFKQTVRQRDTWFGPVEHADSGARTQVVGVPLFTDNDSEKGDLLGVALVTLLLEAPSQTDVVIVSP